jgi:putative flippase GtrA
MNNLITRIWAFLVKREFTKFLVVGVINTVLAYAIYIVFNLFLSYTMAYSIAYFSGFISSYFLNSKWVFQTDVSWKKFFTFPLVYIAQFLISIVALRFLVEQLHFSELLSPLIVIAISVPLTFILSRFLLTNENEPPV